MRRTFTALCLLSAFGCEGTIQPIFPASFRDAATTDGMDGGVDAGPSDPRDGGPGSDAGSDRDGGPEPDGGSMTLPACTNSIADILQAVLAVAPARDSGAYVPLGLGQRAMIPALVDAILLGDDEETMIALSGVGYGACRTPAAEVVLTPATSGAGRALAVVRPLAAQLAILAAPHGLYEIATATITHRAYDELDALALIVTGTHRCANDVASGCDGMTTACGGGNLPYVDSDMAHTTDTAFHAFHLALLDAVATSTAVSLHGTALSEVIVSNGTRLGTTDDSPVARMVGAFLGARPADRVLTCNPFPGGTSSGHLCGTDNVQGRAANGVGNACTVSATGATGRFLHLELSREIRQDPAVIMAALRAALR